MGRTPFVAPLIRPFLPAANLFSYMEAALRVWNRWGRRDNIHKQRIKILVNDLGAEEFTRQVEEEWQAILPNASDVPQVELDRSEEHTSELQSLMRTSYAVFCLKKKTKIYRTLVDNSPHSVYRHTKRTNLIY